MYYTLGPVALLLFVAHVQSLEYWDAVENRSRESETD